MVAARDVAAQINAALNTATKAQDSPTSQNYEALNLDIQNLDSLAREAFQAKLDELFWPVLAKLEAGESLTAAEHEMLEMMVVGEAEYYVKAENDVENWKRELERLVEEIENLQTAGLDDVDTLLKVQARCREAIRVIPDLAFYFREQERVKRFQEATTGTLDKDSSRLLANLIKEMMSSSKM